MRFAINYLYENGLDILELCDDTGYKVQLLPQYGALWHAWFIPYKSEFINLIDHYPDKETLEAELGQTFKGAKLNPFACRIPGGQYAIGEKCYTFEQLSSDGSALHGLLYDKPFTIRKTSTTHLLAEVILTYTYRHEEAGYPFDYDCEICYRLEAGGSLTITTMLHNLSDEKIPVVDGWHPYFRTGTPVNEMELQCQVEDMLEFDERLVPTGKMLPFDQFRQLQLLGAVEMDNSFRTNAIPGKPVCILNDPQKNICIAIYPDVSYPILQIYIPEHRKSIAIENLSGAPDAFNNGIKLRWVNPGDKVAFRVGYRQTGSIKNTA